MTSIFEFVLSRAIILVLRNLFLSLTDDVILSAGVAGGRDPTSAESVDAVERNAFDSCSLTTFIYRIDGARLRTVLRRAFALLRMTSILRTWINI
jgi:hypothetical protein